jgi:hypothetical protein
MDAERRGWHQPAVKARCCDDALAIKKAGYRRTGWHSLTDRRHHRVSLKNFLDCAAVFQNCRERLIESIVRFLSSDRNFKFRYSETLGE